MFTRALKRLIAKIGVAVVLFAQLSVAAHACPVAPDMSQGADAMTMHGNSAASGHCKDLDTVNPNQCQNHCQAGSQSAKSAPHVSVPALATLPLAMAVEFQPIASPGIIIPPALLKRETAPPSSIRFRVFRI